MKKRKIDICLEDFPRELHRFLENMAVYDSSCSSGAPVYYCGCGCYIKVDDKGALAREAELGRIFYDRGLGVEVMDYLSEDKDYLVTRAAEGDDLTHHLDDPKKLCGILAEALGKVHGQSAQGVPLSSRYQRYMDSAGGDMSGGYYDEGVLMDRYRLSSREEAWRMMQQGKGLLRRDTLIHGDACLPNVMAHGGRPGAFIDFSMAGAGDRHIDLYWAAWSLQYNLKTEKYTDYFFDAYGRGNFQEDMLRVIAAFELFG